MVSFANYVVAVAGLELLPQAPPAVPKYASFLFSVRLHPACSLLCWPVAYSFLVEECVSTTLLSQNGEFWESDGLTNYSLRLCWMYHSRWTLASHHRWNNCWLYRHWILRPRVRASNRATCQYARRRCRLGSWASLDFLIVACDSQILRGIDRNSSCALLIGLLSLIWYWLVDIKKETRRCLGWRSMGEINRPVIQFRKLLYSYWQAGSGSAQLLTYRSISWISTRSATGAENKIVWIYAKFIKRPGRDKCSSQSCHICSCRKVAFQYFIQVSPISRLHAAHTFAAYGLVYRASETKFWKAYTLCWISWTIP